MSEQKEPTGRLIVTTAAKLALIYKLWGQHTVLLPVDPGTKKCYMKNWQLTDWQATQDSNYQMKLMQSSIAVLFGRNGLAGLDCDKDRLVGRFLELNPWAMDTLRTRGAHGATFHFKMRGDYPRSLHKYKVNGIDAGEWRGADGYTVVSGIHPETGKPYQILVEKPPLVIDFGQIQWPLEWNLPWTRPQEPPRPCCETLPLPPTVTGDLDKRIRAYLDTISPGVQGQHGSDPMLKAATALVIGFNLGIDGARPYLDLYGSKCDPPWTNRKEVEHKLAEAAKNKRNKPIGGLLEALPIPQKEPKPSKEPGATLWDPDTQQLVPNEDPHANIKRLKIQRTDQDALGWLAKLEKDYHGPTLPSSKGTPAKLNERFWAALYAHEHQTIYEPAENHVYVYIEPQGLFSPQTTESLREQIAARMYEIAALRSGEIGAYSAVRRFVTMQQLGGVVEALKGLTEQKNAFKRTSQSPIYVHAANCMLVWDHGKFHEQPFSPVFRSRNQSPIAYEPEAGYSDFHEAFLERLPDYDASAIKKYFGQCLLGRNLTQSILLMDGVADSSKTTLALVLAALIGPDNCAELRTSQLGERFETSAFIGKTLLMAPDVKANFLSLYGASIIKRLCGSDLGDAEFKRSNRRVQFEGVYNMVVTSNARLRARLEGDAGAWRRRLLIVRSEVPRVGERIVDFHLEIMNREGPGILNFTLEGAKELIADIKCYGGIKMSAEQNARVNKFIDESDSLRNFVRDQLCATSESGYDVTINEVLDRYYEHCVHNELNSLPTKEARKELDEIMHELFGRNQSNSIKREKKEHRGYPKIKWRDEED